MLKECFFTTESHDFGGLGFDARRSSKLRFDLLQRQDLSQEQRLPSNKKYFSSALDQIFLLSFVSRCS